MSLITVKDLTFAYDGSYDNIFENVSFQLDTDWKLGFIGRNGRGKTTFLNLLMGKYEYRGTISAQVSFDYFPPPVPDKSDLTSEIIERISPDCMQWELLRELSLLEVDEDVLYRPFDTLSNGEQTKVMLAALFLKENSFHESCFHLIDEPTNHLDAQGRRTVSKYLRGKSGFILVSHDRAFMDGCIDHVLSINKTNIEIQQGNFSSWYANKERQDNFEISENEKLGKDIARLNKAARERAGWSDKLEATKIGTHQADRGFVGHQAAKTMKRSKAIEARQNRAAAEKSALLKNIESAETLKLAQLPYTKNRLVSLKDISVSYGGRQVCENITFDIESGDRIALTGKNGTGKSSIIKLICGEDIPHTGLAEIGSNLLISYVPQDASGLSGTLSEYAEKHGIDESLFKTILRKLDFSRVQLEKDMSGFSGGQKKKVLIARSLSEKSHLLIWDEPLNFIDVISRMQLEELLINCRPTVLFVEHDSAFSERIATKTVVL